MVIIFFFAKKVHTNKTMCTVIVTKRALTEQLPGILWFICLKSCGLLLWSFFFFSPSGYVQRWLSPNELLFSLFRGMALIIHVISVLYLMLIVHNKDGHKHGKSNLNQSPNTSFIEKSNYKQNNKQNNKQSKSIKSNKYNHNQLPPTVIIGHDMEIVFSDQLHRQTMLLYL